MDDNNDDGFDGTRKGGEITGLRLPFLCSQDQELGLVGSFLLSNHGKVPLSEVTAETICLFFSASWCRPCRPFTPQLLQVYHQLKELKGNNSLEVIFISFDKDEESFESHYATMPWLAVPFNNSLRKHICDHLRVETIPALVPVNLDGSRIEPDAVQLIEDYGVDAFPFTSERRNVLLALDEEKRNGSAIDALFPSDHEGIHLIANNQSKVSLSNLKGKIIGLYFAANWCPPCRDFTLELIEAYTEWKSNNSEEVEIIFISSDKDQEAFNQSVSTMPWPAVSFNDKLRNDLFRIFNVKSIPGLVFIGPNGKALGTDGREMIACHGYKAFPFTKERDEELRAVLEKEKEGMESHAVMDKRHEHILRLEMRRAFICNGCRNEGRLWSFCCARCDYDLHPACVVKEMDILQDGAS